MQRQQVDNQKGEITFRRKLYEQQVEGKHIFDDEFDADGIERILAERMRSTFARMSALRSRGITLSPYLEIGAERGQRSLVMENDLAATGAAADISFDMLRSGAHYRTVFGRERLPLRICCDVNVLPFRSDSLPFVFCYETLHHFPDPAPVITELHRVLAPGGHFLFEEEPFRQALHVNLYRGGKAYADASLRRGTLRKIFDRFFRAQSCNEVEYGILENHDIPVRTWLRALAPFARRELSLRTPGGISIDPLRGRLHPKYLAAWMFGGEISGLCTKAGRLDETPGAIENVLVCPSCRDRGEDASLQQDEHAHRCTACGTRYPVVDGVLFLLRPAALDALYPDIAPSTTGI